MSLRIEVARCIGCNLCVALCPQVYELLANGKAQVKADADLAIHHTDAIAALDACPVQAIIENE